MPIPPELPPEQVRTRADRMSDVSPMVWTVLGFVTILVFSVLLFLLNDVAGG